MNRHSFSFLSFPLIVLVGGLSAVCLLSLGGAALFLLINSQKMPQPSQEALAVLVFPHPECEAGDTSAERFVRYMYSSPEGIEMVTRLNMRLVTRGPYNDMFILAKKNCDPKAETEDPFKDGAVVPVANKRQPASAPKLPCGGFIDVRGKCQY